MSFKSSEPTSIADIARRAGVAESTVSRALNNHPNISVKTREMIQALAREMNYSLNTGARNLRMQRSHSVSVVINAAPNEGQKFSDPFMMDMMGAIADKLSEYDYSLLFPSPSLSIGDWYSHLLGSRRSDGIIVIGQGKDDRELKKLHQKGAPFVVWGASTPAADYCVVGSDNYLGGQQATQHLISKGCKRLVFLGDTTHIEIEDRFQGYLDTLDNMGLKTNEFHLQSAFSVDSGYRQTQKLLEAGLVFDGIFSASDNIAMGAIMALKEKGIRVPDDVRVIGFDNIPYAPYFDPPLTTIKQDIHRGGELLVEKMIALIAGGSVSAELLETELIIRASA